MVYSSFSSVYISTLFLVLQYVLIFTDKIRSKIPFFYKYDMKTIFVKGRVLNFDDHCNNKLTEASSVCYFWMNECSAPEEKKIIIKANKSFSN